MKPSPRRFLILFMLPFLCMSCASFQGARLYASGSQALERGETRRAIHDLERAAELVPHASEIQNHLGLAYTEAGQEAQALAAFRRAVELDCDNQAAAHNLARAEALGMEAKTP